MMGGAGRVGSGSGSFGAGGVVQAARMPKISNRPTLSAVGRPSPLRSVMHLLYLQALGALLILVFIIWWTMFCGRKNGELPDKVEREKAHEARKDATQEDKSS